VPDVQVGHRHAAMTTPSQLVVALDGVWSDPCHGGHGACVEQVIGADFHDVPFELVMPVGHGKPGAAAV